MNSTFWSGLIEAIVAFFLYADMKGMMVLESVTGFVVSLLLPRALCNGHKREVGPHVNVPP